VVNERPSKKKDEVNTLSFKRGHKSKLHEVSSDLLGMLARKRIKENMP